MIWVPPIAVVVFHDRQVSRHGGKPGIKDRAAIDVALAMPLERFERGEKSAAALAAAYAYGTAKAHAFVDGNKRTAFVTAAAFLRLNGYSFRPKPVEGVRMMEDLARDAINEEAFAEWLGQGLVELTEKTHEVVC